MFTTMGKHLMGAREIEDRLDISRQRVQQLLARDDWPEPFETLAMGKVWRTEDIEEWIREHRPHLAPTGPPKDPQTDTDPQAAADREPDSTEQQPDSE